MGATKSAHFTETQNQIANLAKAVGHPARVAILQYLMQANHCICGDIVNELPLAQATVSQHLKELKLAGLIKGSIEGNSICYCIDESAVQVLKGFFDAMSNQVKRINQCC